MKLKKLLSGLPVEIKGRADIQITGVCNHSKKVHPGALFIAKKGAHHDGTLYISDAKSFGAAAVVTDLYNPFITGLTQVVAKDIADIEAIIATRYYAEPSKKLSLVGITGTNGKTTTAYLIAHLLNADKGCGLITTIERAFQDYEHVSTLTTPDAIDTQKYLYEMQMLGAKKVVMEVTSHALAQNRVACVHFEVGVFTNLSVDHLDYHGSIDDYFEAKARLFCDPNIAAKHQVINLDDEWGKKLIKRTKASPITYAIENEGADLRAYDIKMQWGKTSLTLTYKGEEVAFQCPIMGEFNVYNILASVGVALSYGLSLEVVAKRLKTFKGVPGRMEWVKAHEPYQVCVDFAHTEQALEKTLQALSRVKKGRIITLFGCGGDRDKSKRAAMAKVAETFSDLVVITSDNVRSEDPDLILNAIEKGFSEKAHVVRKKHRKEAIAYAMGQAREDDIVLLAGRGHEAHLHTGSEIIPFSDKAVALELMRPMQEKGAGQ